MALIRTGGNGGGYSLDTVTMVNYTQGTPVSCNIGDRFILSSDTWENALSHLSLTGATALSEAHTTVTGALSCLVIVEATAASFTFNGTDGAVWVCYGVD